jgi:hypothetical protein
MKLIADQKRRVVLPQPVKPGDALEVISKGDRIVLTILKKPEVCRPPVAAKPLRLSAETLRNMDGPAFDDVSDEGLA